MRHFVEGRTVKIFASTENVLLRASEIELLFERKRDAIRIRVVKCSVLPLALDRENPSAIYQCVKLLVGIHPVGGLRLVYHEFFLQLLNKLGTKVILLS